MTNEMPLIGETVQIVIDDDSPLYTTKWWPKHGQPVTGTVQKIFKNGNVAVAIHQIRNFSEDGLHTMHFPISEVVWEGSE
jgi:hypothetical protein